MDPGCLKSSVPKKFNNYVAKNKNLSVMYDEDCYTFYLYVFLSQKPQNLAPVAPDSSSGSSGSR